MYLCMRDKKGENLKKRLLRVENIENIGRAKIGDTKGRERDSA